MTANYQENSIDTDFTYISANDTNYSVISSFNIPTRKTVVFGQNALASAYPVGNFGNNYIPQYHTVPKIDNDNTQVIGVTPTAVYYSDTIKTQTYIRGSFNLLENIPQTGAWLGISNTTAFSPIQVGNSSYWSKIQVSCQMRHSSFIKNDGSLWMCGYGLYGQLGNNTSGINVSSPVQLGTFGWLQSSCGGLFTSAIQSNGTLWTWGNNGSGQLGQSNTTNRSSPVQVGTLSDWSQVSCGYFHTASIKSNGTLWTWGSGASGQLGLNTTSTVYSPIQVGTESYWSQVFCGGKTTLLINSSGTLWSCGYNSNGQLGLSDTANRLTPVQVGTLSTWSKIACSYNNAFAIKTDGTLWSWGSNLHGQLGQSNTTNRSSPVQVGALSNWSRVSAGGLSNQTNFMIATKTDGTLWSCGYNAQGKLGLGDTTTRYSPVQVGTLSNWSQISCGTIFAVGLKTDGTLWSWGHNNNGQLGVIQNALLPTKLSTGF